MKPTKYEALRNDSKRLRDNPGGGAGALGSSSAGVGGNASGGGGGSGPAGGRNRGGSPSTRSTFHSYIATSPDGEEADPDGLDHKRRLELEKGAVKLILRQEPELKKAGKGNNEGFDLYEGNLPRAERFIEVKAMSGDWTSRPVGLSSAQFEFASLAKEKYWLYVVENAGTKAALVRRIQNPARRGSTFTFDHGWLQATEPDGK